MDKSAIIAEIKNAQSALRTAMKLLKDEGGIETPDRYVVGTCKKCGEPIYVDDDVQREVHVACYHEMYREDPTLEKFEKLEQIGPRGKPGRKKKAERLGRDPMSAVKRGKLDESDAS